MTKGPYRPTVRGRILATMSSRVLHFEIQIDDADRTGAFYRTAFDWNVTN